MLETFAYGFFHIGDTGVYLISVALVLIGNGIGIFLRRGSTVSIRRAPYALLLATFYVLANALSFSWLLIHDAMRNHVLWLLLLAIYGTLLSVSTVAGALAHARSVSAFGDGRRAWMAMVPGLNLVLLFKRPLDWQPVGWGRFAVNAVTVALALCLSAAGTRLILIANEQMKVLARAGEADQDLARIRIGFAIKWLGLEGALKDLASDVPERIDESTTLQRVEGTANTLRYIYTLAPDVPALDASVVDRIKRQNCAYPMFQPLFEAGAAIEHVFKRPDGSSVGTVIVNRTNCSI